MTEPPVGDTKGLLYFTDGSLAYAGRYRHDEFDGAAREVGLRERGCGRQGNDGYSDKRHTARNSNKLRHRRSSPSRYCRPWQPF